MATERQNSPPGANAVPPEPAYSQHIFECRVCNESYSTTVLAKTPRLLHGCGHTVCQQCVDALISQQNRLTGNHVDLFTPSVHTTILCPFDRTPTILIQEQGIVSGGLKKNFALIELIERLNNVQLGSAFAESTPIAAQSAETGESSASSGENRAENQSQTDMFFRERLLGIACDEDRNHTAVVYCIVCESHLCSECSTNTHRANVLAKHRRVPLSEKPHPKPKCPYHSAYGLEFVCQDSECGNTNRLMCLLCKDYGRHRGHKFSLLEIEAVQLRKQLSDALNEFRPFTVHLLNWASTLGQTVADLTDGSEGSAVRARRQVLGHFTELKELLASQEAQALCVVETHAKDRLNVLRQQQEHLATLISQVSAVCTQFDKSGQLDDARLVEQQTELNRLFVMVRKQHLDCANLPSQLALDSRITLAFTRDNRVHIGANVEMRVVLLGLDGAGKTTLVFKLKNNEIMQTTSTIGFNVETIEYKNLKLTLWDVGGLPKLRPLWKHYYLNTQALIFVIDSSDQERFPEVQSELVKILSENDLRDASLLIFLNKQVCQEVKKDKESAIKASDLVESLTLSKLCYGRSWHVQPCDAISAQGLNQGLDWLASQLLPSAVNTSNNPPPPSPPSASGGNTNQVSPSSN